MVSRGRWGGRRRGATSGQIALAILATCAGLAIFGFIGYETFSSHRTIVDKTTFCPERVSDVTAVLIDATDELNPIQRASIRERLDEVKGNIPRFGRIDLYSLAVQNEGMPTALFTVCNPGTEKDADPLGENAKLMAKHWKRDFSTKIDATLDKIVSEPDSPNSPIMEAVQAVAIKSFGTEQTRDAEHKRLVIVSDMIQYTKDYSQYKGIGSGEIDTFVKSEAFRKVRSNLRGADVEIFYIRRETKSHVQGKEHKLFWEKFVKACEGRVTRIAEVEG